MVHLGFANLIACFATTVDVRKSCTAWENAGTPVNDNVDMTTLP